ncbi:MAG: hypothetical protein K2H96_05295 [Muribaculaceae bacterium]|nr:hypothetical protein [Muribaculaceae bacterium]
MTQLTLNIEDNEMLWTLKKLIQHLNGVSIANTAEEYAARPIEAEMIASDIRTAYGEVIEHLQDKRDLPLAKDIKF